MSQFIEIKERRNNDTEILNAFDGWESVTQDFVYSKVSSTCGNISYDVEGEYDIKSHNHTKDLFNGKSFYKSVSAPYLLARLVAAGMKVETRGQEGYKTTWHVWMRHKETGHFLSFYDYKGASSYGSDVYGKTAPKEFIKAVTQIILAVTNDRFPHPYDGCVVGEIA